jgi:hypothetical protein
MTAEPLTLRFTCPADTTALWRASARYLAGLAAMIRWARPDNTSLSGRSFRRIDYAPGGIFDPLFTGISANAAGINAAICRHPYLRRSL